MRIKYFLMFKTQIQISIQQVLSLCFKSIILELLNTKKRFLSQNNPVIYVKTLSKRILSVKPCPKINSTFNKTNKL